MTTESDSYVAKGSYTLNPIEGGLVTDVDITFKSQKSGIVIATGRGPNPTTSLSLGIDGPVASDGSFVR